MKIINRAAFLALPVGVLFSKYEPCNFGPLEIKGVTCVNGTDFIVQQIADAIDADDCGELVDKCFAAVEAGTSIALDLNRECRDGSFDEGQLFAVWEAADIAQLMARLARVVPA